MLFWPKLFAKMALVPEYKGRTGSLMISGEAEKQPES
jgi:hypothetical protein